MFIWSGPQCLVFLLCLLITAKRSVANGVFTLSAQGHRLEKSLLKETNAANAIHCLHQCLHEDPHCKSVNYGATSEAKGKCELNNATVQDKYNSKKLVANKDFHYFERVMKGKPSFCYAPPRKSINTLKDINECNSNPCHRNGTCNNTPGSYTCICNRGFTGNGINCTDVNECISNPCHGNASCSNILGSYKCSCQDGFVGNGTSCTDVDECITSPCHQDTICNNTLGSYKCTCRHGEMVNGIRCEDSFSSSKILGGDGKYLKQLYQWLNNKIKWKLCYRASYHGWGGRDFHSNCDGKGQTVTIVRVGDYIFGGYSDVDWKDLGNYGFRRSSKAFLFSLRNKDNLKPFKSSLRRPTSSNAIMTIPFYGPTFGGGHDLYIADSSNTFKLSYTRFGKTYQPPPGYSYGATKTKELLAGSFKFRTSEIEVYYMY